MNEDRVLLKINGKSFFAWKEITVTRGIDRTVSSFQLLTGGNSFNQIIAPFDACELWVDNDKLLTGYIEAVDPEFDKSNDQVRIVGHSKTKDLTDCTPDIRSGQFNGFTVAAICRAICALFGIELVVLTDKADAVVQNTNLQRGETAFRFMERLCNLAGVLMTDDEQGRLVLTIAGGTYSTTRLLQGINIERLRGQFNVARRYSQYIVKGQAGIASGNAFNLDGVGGISAAPSVGTVQTAMRAVATDPDVPRYRPHVTIAESQLTPAQMQARANWQKQYAYGQSIKITARVRGFRQDDGTLWKPNLMIPLTASKVFADNDLLIARVEFILHPQSEGHVTDLLLGPIEGYTPDPGSVKLRKMKKGKKAAAGYNLDGVGGE